MNPYGIDRRHKQANTHYSGRTEINRHESFQPRLHTASFQRDIAGASVDLNNCATKNTTWYKGQLRATFTTICNRQRYVTGTRIRHCSSAFNNLHWRTSDVNYVGMVPCTWVSRWELPHTRYHIQGISSLRPQIPKVSNVHTFCS